MILVSKPLSATSSGMSSLPHFLQYCKTEFYVIFIVIQNVVHLRSYNFCDFHATFVSYEIIKIDIICELLT